MQDRQPEPASGETVGFQSLAAHDATDAEDEVDEVASGVKGDVPEIIDIKEEEVAGLALFEAADTTARRSHDRSATERA